jgi:SAM-dependent methyltransferase
MSFDRFSATYENDVEKSIGFTGLEHAFFLEAKAEHLLRVAHEQLGKPAALRFLDVGCGIGAMETFLAERTGSVCGVDVSAEIVERAKEQIPWAEFTAYDGRKLPFADGSFDVVFAICVLHHVDRPERPALVREMRRVVRAGGLVFVAEHNPWNPLTRLAIHRCAFDEGVELLPRREVELLFTACGLTLAESRYILFLPSRAPNLRALEARLGRLPLGAQHVVAAIR